MTDSAYARQPRLAVPSSDADDPTFTVSAGGDFDGVAELVSDNGNGTATLLTTGRHLLTSASAFQDEDGFDLDPTPGNYSIAFDLPGGRTSIEVSRVFLHPDWTGDGIRSNDIAVVEIAETAPEAATRYDIYTETDEVGETFTLVGYGVDGTGASGQANLSDDSDDASTSPEAGTKRSGQNVFDALGDVVFEVKTDELSGEVVSGSQLAFDFDNGDSANDFFGTYFDIAGTGLGASEVFPTAGDLGAPGFLSDRIAALTSFYTSPITTTESGAFRLDLLGQPNTDVSFVEGEVLEIDTVGEIARARVAATNSSFGEVATATRISAYASYISETLAEAQSGNDAILGTSGDDTLNGNAGSDTIEGLAGDDILAGGQGADSIVGAEGSDTILGNLGDDDIFGSADDDLLVGGAGNDSLDGGDDGDTILGGEGSDIISGAAGSDTVFAGAGNDGILGGEDDDLILGDDGSDTLEGNEGDDLLFGNQGSDSILGGSGDDSLYGGQDNDTLEGGDGNDTLTGDLGRDVLSGGEGADVFVLSEAGAVTDAASADLIVDFSFEDDTIGLAGGLTQSDVILENATVNGDSGVLIKVSATEEILGFVAGIDTVPFVEV